MHFLWICFLLGVMFTLGTFLVSLVVWLVVGSIGLLIIAGQWVKSKAAEEKS
jgi:hypothetical protein